jgi:rhamnosyltransferase
LISSFSVIVPTLRPGSSWRNWLDAFAGQTVRPDRAILVDSGSGGDTVELAVQYGFEPHIIKQEDFDHGRTRMLGVENSGDSEIVIFLTQDAELATADSIEQLLKCFFDKAVGAAYGRQLPAREATPIAAHARLYNYPKRSRVKSRSDIPDLGIMAARFSNSFGAYRRSALMEVGGFPASIIFGEDQVVASRLLLKNWKIAYEAGAQVRHSHNYTPTQEFNRYYDIGVFHSATPWMMEEFGGAGGEGMRFVWSEFQYLWRHAPGLIPSAFSRTALKYVAYRLGRMAPSTPLALKRRMSMNKRYWGLPEQI